ncbi:hypothetical protein IL306_006564 [Fusarium sp. DS 682]|nr:hypothetical protein IL306_006564 [Fusarium sp. DS 682]
MRIRHQGMLADDEALLKYARELYKAQSSRGRPWNGRQIRNAFQSAVAIANFEKAPGSSLRLTTNQFKKVSQSYDEFNQYLFSVNGEPIHTSGDTVIAPSRRDAQRHRVREAPAESLPPNSSSISSSGDTSPRRSHQPTDNEKELHGVLNPENWKAGFAPETIPKLYNQTLQTFENLERLHSAPRMPSSSSNIATQEQQNFQPKQNRNHPVSPLGVQPQSPYALPGWAPIQNMALMPTGMGYGPMGMPIPMQQQIQMAAPFQYHNAAMNHYNIGGLGSPFQFPPNTLGVPLQYSQFTNHFQSKPVAPQPTQPQSSQPQPSQSESGQASSSQTPSGKESGGGFWGRLNQDDETSHPSAWQQPRTYRGDMT